MLSENQSANNEMPMNPLAVAATLGQAMMSDEEAISAAMKSYAYAFVREDYDALVRLWDPKYADQIIYVGSELPTPLMGLEALKSYYTQVLQAYEILTAEVTDIQIRRDGAFAYAFCFITWTYHAKGGGPVKSFCGRTTYVMRRRGDAWLYHHLSESVTWDEAA